MKIQSKKKEDRFTLQVDVPCMFACPARTNIPEYIHAITNGDYNNSYFINQAKNVFPGSLGRVCTRPCEDACRHGYAGYGESVSICRLKRSSADYKVNFKPPVKKQRTTGKNVAVIGGGPAGLAACRDLLLFGHRVTIFESSSQLGGMMPLAIPRFRLPGKVIQDDISLILDLGLKTRMNTTLGKDIFLDECLQQYDAVLLAVGCQKPYRLGVPGEDLKGVYSGLQFLMDIVGQKRLHVGKKSLVIGGGYTAVDCARALIRLGVPNVTMIFWKTPENLTLDKEEMHHLEIEDVSIRYLTTVDAFIEGENQVLEKVNLVRTRMDNNKVIPIKDSVKSEKFDSAIVCIGQGALGKPFIQDAYQACFRNERLTVNQDTFMSSQKGLFGAGDYVNQTRSIIDAIGDGRKAALGIHAYLTNTGVKSPIVQITTSKNTNRKRTDDFIPRVREKNTLGQSIPHMNLEVNCGFTKSESQTESKRCYLCHQHYEIDLDNCIYCMRCIDEAPVDCIKQILHLGHFRNGKREYIESDQWNEIGAIYIDNDVCVRCGKCLEVCPTRCISVSQYTLVDQLFGDKA